MSRTTRPPEVWVQIWWAVAMLGALFLIAWHPWTAFHAPSDCWQQYAVCGNHPVADPTLDPPSNN